MVAINIPAYKSPKPPNSPKNIFITILMLSSAYFINKRKKLF